MQNGLQVGQLPSAGNIPLTRLPINVFLIESGGKGFRIVLFDRVLASHKLDR